MRRLILALPLLLIMGCSDKNLEQVAKSMVILSTSVGQLQTSVIELNTAKAISDNTTREILQVCEKINVAGLQVDTVLRIMAEKKLDVATAKTIIDLLKPISMALDPDKLAFIAGIDNPMAKQRVESYFILLRTTVSTLQIVLAGVA